MSMEWRDSGVRQRCEIALIVVKTDCASVAGECGNWSATQKH